MSSPLFSYLLLNLILFSSFRAEGFKFEIMKNLNDGQILDKDYRTSVEITGGCNPDKDVSIIVNIGSSLRDTYSNVKIFFANDAKEILEIDMSEKIQGKFYSTPYQVVKTMKGGNTNKEDVSGGPKISGSFPGHWLPRNCNKISGVVSDKNGNFYNYYGIKNYQISIPDLLLVEEYERYNCRS